MDLLVVIVEVCARRVSDAGEVAQDQCYGARRRDCGCEDGRLLVLCRVGGVEVLDYRGQGGFEGRARVGEEGQEGLGCGVSEVVDVEAELWLGRVGWGILRFWIGCLLGLVPGDCGGESWGSACCCHGEYR